MSYDMLGLDPTKWRRSMATGCWASCFSCVVTVYVVGRTLCVHQYDRDVLQHIRDTMSECDMQPNYRFNDIVLPGQNLVRPAGQRPWSARA